MVGPRDTFFAIYASNVTNVNVANLLDTSQKLNRPSESDYTSVENYMHNREPLLEAEGSWIRKKEDLITLRSGREYAWLDSGIKKILKWFHCGILEVKILTRNFLFMLTRLNKQSLGTRFVHQAV